MKNRIKKKIKNRRLKLENWISKVCIVNASESQLESIGCNSELLLTQEVLYIKDYPTGYSQVRVERKDISKVLGKPSFEYYDIPKEWLEIK